MAHNLFVNRTGYRLFVSHQKMTGLSSLTRREPPYNAAQED
jgi:hypothetical protein